MRRNLHKHRNMLNICTISCIKILLWANVEELSIKTSCFLPSFYASAVYACLYGKSCIDIHI